MESADDYIKRQKKIFGNVYGYSSKKKSSKGSCPQTIRNQLRVKWWKGKYEGTCFCCGRKITYEHIEAGRIKAGGKYSVPNTRLICKTCNRGMGKHNLKIYMKRNYLERYEKYFPKEEKTIKTKKTIKRKSQEINMFGMPKFKQPKFDFWI